LIIIRKLKTILILNSENILHHEKQWRFLVMEYA
jgi:hypothetical protein